MRITTGLSVAALCGTVVLASACSDSTSPNGSNPSHVAAHFDSLYVTAAAMAEGSENYGERALLLSFIEAAAAYGSSPTTVDVTTANGSEQWKAYEIEDIEEGGSSALDTTFLVVAYRESAAHTIALAEYDASGHIYGGEIITNDSLPVEPSDGDGFTERASLGGSCSTPSASLLNQQIGTLAGFACTPATFNTSMVLVTDPDPNVDDALTSISIPTSTVNGEVFTASEAGGVAVRRLRALLHKRMGGKRL